MKIHSLVFALLLSAQAAPAQWIEKTSKAENSAESAVQHRHLRFENTMGERADLELAVFPVKANVALRVVDNPGGSADLAEAMQSSGCVAGVNGGYFDPAFAPLGLRVTDGKVVRPVLHARLMTGILLWTPGSFQVLRTAEYSVRRKAVAALQCGPLLVDAGQPVKGLNATRPARRTFAAVAGDRAALGVSSEVSLAEAAQIMATLRLDQTRVSRALNLDGGSSSAFWCKRADGSAFSISEMKNVRDFIGIAPR